MPYFWVLIFVFVLEGCSPCRGTYTETDNQGNLRKYNEHSVEGVQGCVTDNVSLSHWEESLQARTKKRIACTPQLQFNSRTLVAQGNFYEYRDGRVYLDLDSSTGEYRLLILAEGVNGEPVFSRKLGCFFQRTATGVDAAFGSQLLLDAKDVASSQYLNPAEVFQITETINTLDMVRFDASSDWTAYFCPTIQTEFKYCTLLRNGNEMFEANLTAAQQVTLIQEAIKIRKVFSYVAISKDQFSSAWSAAEKERKEVSREEYKFEPYVLVDTPIYIDQAWFSFVRNERPTMPDVSSTTTPRICWSASKDITYPDGSIGKVYGEACLENGVFEFTPL